MSRRTWPAAWPATLLVATPSGTLGLRLDGSWLLYGSETVRIPVARTAGRIVREITTENWVAQAGVGPQLVLPLRGAASGYLHGFAGLSYLSTESRSARSRPASRRRLDQLRRHRLRLRRRRRGGRPAARPWPSLDLGVRYVRTSSVRFLAEGDLGPDGGGGRARAAPRAGQRPGVPVGPRLFRLLALPAALSPRSRGQARAGASASGASRSSWSLYWSW